MLCAIARADDRILKHDSGRQSGKQSVAVAGHLVRFRAPYSPCHLRSVLVHGARYGTAADATFEVAICDEKLRPLATVRARYDLFLLGNFTWAEVPLAKPVEVPRAFTVVVDFRPTRDRGVYVGYSDVSRSHSAYGRAGGPTHPFAKDKDWMIRARVTQEPRPFLPPRDAHRRLREARVRDLDKRGLRDALAHVSAAAGIPVVLDPAFVRRPRAPAIANASAVDALTRITHSAGLAWDVRWGVVFVAEPQRSSAIPREIRPPTGRLQPAQVVLRTLLWRRRIDLDCRGLRLERALARIADRLEFRVFWSGGVEKFRKVSVQARALLGHQALAVLLLPHGYTFRIAKRGLVIVPLRPPR